MKRILCLALTVVLAAPVAMAVEKGTVEEYRKIIQSRCTSCHEPGRIEKAMAEGRNVKEILNKMQGMGAELTERDRDVLGIFWGSPIKEK